MVEVMKLAPDLHAPEVPPVAPVASDALGPHIKRARLERGYTMAQLAQATKLSRSYLSNVERDVNSPTISTLRTILDALGVSLSQLFRTVEGAPRILTTLEQRVQIARTGNAAITYQLLNPNPTGRLEMLIMEVAPGASSGDVPHTHAGEEVGLMLSGELDYWIGEVKYHVCAGDSLSFESIAPHRYSNPGTKPSASVWAITPPSF